MYAVGGNLSIATSCSAATLDQIPTEVMMLVFSSLSTPEKIHACLVSKRWHAIISDNDLWKSMGSYFEYSPIPKDEQPKDEMIAGVVMKEFIFLKKKFLEIQTKKNPGSSSIEIAINHYKNLVALKNSFFKLMQLYIAFCTGRTFYLLSFFNDGDLIRLLSPFINILGLEQSCEDWKNNTLVQKFIKNAMNDWSAEEDYLND